MTLSVDENVELMSILAKLAGYDEYSMNQAGDYSAETDAWFEDYSSHPAVKLMKRLRKSNGIAFDAVASMAVNLRCDGDNVSLLPLEEGTLESRWDGVNLDKFMRVINSFYDDSRFHDFFRGHKGLYDNVIDGFRKTVLDGLDISWYERFYGNEIPESFHIVLGMTNGGCNYGVKRYTSNGNEEPYALLGYYLDKDGVSGFSGCLGTLIHEFNHSFVNEVVESSAKVKDSGIGDMLFAVDPDRMGAQAYGNGITVLNESIVRAAVIVYLMEHNAGDAAVQAEMQEQIDRGFLWMPELVGSFKQYETSRGLYPTFADYLPEIIKVLDGWCRAR